MKNANKDVYEAIVNYVTEHGFAPTVRELCELTGKKSTSTIKYNLDKLEEDGYIKRVHKSPRTIIIL